MQLKVRHTLSKKYIYAIALLVSLIVLAALVVLSFLLTQESRRSNEDFAEKAFYSKYESVGKELNAIAEHQNLLKDLVAKSNADNFKSHFQILNELNQPMNILQYNWYTTLGPSAHHKFFKVALASAKDSKQPRLLGQTNDVGSGFILGNLNRYYWVSYDSIKIRGKGIYYFGNTVDLENLHYHFATSDNNQSNYAFVFTKDGTCIFHPEQKFIGGNVFELSNLKPKDTMSSISKLGFTRQKAASEYLNLEVTRFVKPIKTSNFDGYVAVNYVNLLIEENVDRTRTYVAALFGVTFLLILIVFILFYQSTQKAYLEKEKIQSEKNRLLIDNEKMHKQKALSQLEQLKNKVNPHFLFNSLNSLYMLIGLDPTKAQKFTLNLSKIYRYLIVPPKENLVPLKEELAFIDQYIALQKDRFQNELIFKIEIKNKSSLEKKLPYLSLEITLENAIKHNVATLEQPLLIEIFEGTHGVFVRNSLQKKNNPESGEQFGLKYLQKTYAFYKNSQFKIEVNSESFIVFLPFVEV